MLESQKRSEGSGWTQLHENCQTRTFTFFHLPFTLPFSLPPSDRARLTSYLDNMAHPNRNSYPNYHNFSASEGNSGVPPSSGINSSQTPLGGHTVQVSHLAYAQQHQQLPAYAGVYHQQAHPQQQYQALYDQGPYFRNQYQQVAYQVPYIYYQGNAQPNLQSHPVNINNYQGSQQPALHVDQNGNNNASRPQRSNRSRRGRANINQRGGR